MVSWFASGMMFGRTALLRDACHNFYQFTRFSWPQSDRLHSIWRRKKDVSPYSTAHPRAFGFRKLWFFCFFFSMDCINWIFQPKKRRRIFFGSSILTIIMPILPKKIFRWSRGPPFSVDEIRMKVYYLNASFLWLALPNPILACGNVIRISSPKFFFLWKQEMESVVLKSALFHQI